MSEKQDLKRIADSLEKIARLYEDPAAYLENLIGRLGESLARFQAPMPMPPLQQVGVVPGVPPAGVGELAPGVAVTTVEVKLSDEERKAICDQALADIEEQMSDFKGFISQALSELPEPTLKRIGELMQKGEKFKLRRRHGCVYMDFGHGDDDFYLRM